MMLSPSARSRNSTIRSPLGTSSLRAQSSAVSTEPAVAAAAAMGQQQANPVFITSLSAKDIVIGAMGRGASPKSYQEIIRRTTLNLPNENRSVLAQSVLDELLKTGHQFVWKSKNINVKHYKVLNIEDADDKALIENRVKKSLKNAKERRHCRNNIKKDEPRPSTKRKSKSVLRSHAVPAAAKSYAADPVVAKLGRKDIVEPSTKSKSKPNLWSRPVPAASMATTVNPVIEKPGSKDIVLGAPRGEGTAHSYLNIIHQYVSQYDHSESADFLVHLTQGVSKHLLETGHRFVKKQKAGNYQILDIEKDTLAIYNRVYDSLRNMHYGQKNGHKQNQPESNEEESDEKKSDEEEPEEESDEAEWEEEDNGASPVVLQRKQPPSTKIAKHSAVAYGNKKRKAVMPVEKEDFGEDSPSVPRCILKVARRQSTSPTRNMSIKLSSKTAPPASKQAYNALTYKDSDSAMGKMQDLDVGSRVAVWWDGNSCYFPGAITNCGFNEHGQKTGKFYVEYDDGGKGWEDLSKSRWLLVSQANKTDGSLFASPPSPDSKAGTTMTPFSRALIQQPRSSTASNNGRLALSNAASGVSCPNEGNETDDGSAFANSQGADEYWTFTIKAKQTSSPGETVESDLDAFVVLQKDCDYATARQEIEEQLVPEVLSVKTTWFFIHPPMQRRMSRKQESMLHVNLKELQKIQGTEIPSISLNVVAPSNSTCA